MYLPINSAIYAKECRCCKQSNIDSHNLSFLLYIHIQNLFIISDEIPKEKLHVKTYDAMYPFVKAFIANLTANAGIPPVYIPYIDISNQSIYRVEMPGKIKRTEEEE